MKINFTFFDPLAEGPTPEVIVTKPSPDQGIIAPLGLRPENSTLVHVLVHRESEEYKEEEDEHSPLGKLKHNFYLIFEMSNGKKYLHMFICFYCK